MKNLLTTAVWRMHRNLFTVRQVLPIAMIVALILISLLLPGTVFAGPGSSSGVCGSC